MRINLLCFLISWLLMVLYEQYYPMVAWFFWTLGAIMERNGWNEKKGNTDAATTALAPFEKKDG